MEKFEITLRLRLGLRVDEDLADGADAAARGGCFAPTEAVEAASGGRPPFR